MAKRCSCCYSLTLLMCAARLGTQVICRVLASKRQRDR